MIILPLIISSLISGTAADRPCAQTTQQTEQTDVCTTADSDLEASSREAGAAADLAASHRAAKYVGLSSEGEFVPTAVESRGPINRCALQFLSELSRRLVEATGDVRASLFLFQRISVAV